MFEVWQTDLALNLCIMGGCASRPSNVESVVQTRNDYELVRPARLWLRWRHHGGVGGGAGFAARALRTKFDH